MRACHYATLAPFRQLTLPIRLLCLLLSGTVTLATVPLPSAFGSSVGPATQDDARQAPPSTGLGAPDFFDRFTIPEQLGHIVERWMPTDTAPTQYVIHLQDLHTQAAAQRTLSDLIGYLHDKFGITSVALEGAEGLCDTTLYS